MRLFLEEAVKSPTDFEIIRSYFDGSIALDSLKSKKPDVIYWILKCQILTGCHFLKDQHQSKNLRSYYAITQNMVSEMINQDIE